MAETGTNPDGSQRERLDQLPRQAQLSGYPTPMSVPDSPASHNATGLQERTFYKETFGASSKSSKPATGNAAASRSLNPFFSAWLMALPTHWMLCGILAQLKLKSKKSRKPSVASRLLEKSPVGSPS
jgi:hypothetical protein